jgi:glutathione S-transferase
MENALPFFAVGFLYCMTQPSALLARSLFFGFFALRVLHTLFYLRGMQPARALSFMGGVLVNVAMAVQVVHAIV